MNLQGTIDIFGFGPAAIVMALVMVLALVGMIACAKKQDTTPAAKPAAIACMIIIILCAIGILITTGMFGDAEMQRAIHNEVVYRKALAFVSGKYIGDKYPGAKILLLADKDAAGVRQEEMIKEFKRGLGGRCEIVGRDVPRPLPTLPAEGAAEIEPAAPARTPSPGMPGVPGTPGTMVTPIQMVMTAETVMASIAKYPDANMIVTFVGLPRDFANMDIWYEEDESKKIKVGVIGGDVSQIGPAIAAGQIVAAATHNPKAKFDESRAPSEPQAAFDKKYLLITPENVEQIAREFPGLFEVQQQ